MTPLDEAELDERSAAFARALFSAQPAWRQYARADSRDGEKYLVVEVPPPIESRVNYPLMVDTSNGEVTIGFDHYHDHFAWPCFDDQFGNPIQFANDIVRERVTVVSFWAGEKWLGSRTMLSSEKVNDLQGIPGEARKIKLRSWTGRYSADLEIP